MRRCLLPGMPGPATGPCWGRGGVAPTVPPDPLRARLASAKATPPVAETFLGHLAGRAFLAKEPKALCRYAQLKSAQGAALDTMHTLEKYQMPAAEPPLAAGTRPTSATTLTFAKSNKTPGQRSMSAQLSRLRPLNGLIITCP